MFHELEAYLVGSFMFAIRLGLKLAWAVLRPILPDLIRAVFSLLRYPVTWTAIFITALWVLTDHGIAASLVAVAAIAAALAAVLLRPGLR